jgi:hypothetical protein
MKFTLQAQRKPKWKVSLFVWRRDHDMDFFKDPFAALKIYKEIEAMGNATRSKFELYNTQHPYKSPPLWTIS